MLFSEIIGQQDIKQRLIRSVTEQRIPHAQLFMGSEGVGKLALAIAYAQYIACLNPSQTDACGTCSSCVKFNKLAHPDLHFVFPIIKPKGKTSAVCDDYIVDFRERTLQSPYFTAQEWFDKISDETKQGMIYASESQEIIRKLSLKTYESEYKTMIIWLPEKMNETCANKLLKILEEPPEKTIFILVSNQPEHIIGTILSRTQHIHIPRLTQKEISLALMSHPGIDIDFDEANYVARTSNGSFTSALSLLDVRSDNRENFDQFVHIMRMAWKVGNLKEHASLKLLKKWSEDFSAAAVGREKQKSFLLYAQKMTRESYIFNLKHPNLNYLATFETGFVQNFASFIHERNVEDLVAEFAMAQRHIEQNVYAKMVFFDLVLKLIILLRR